MTEQKRITCRTHGETDWKATVVCEGCGRPYKFEPSRRRTPETYLLLDAEGHALEAPVCPCGAKFPEGLKAVCGRCHAALVAQRAANASEKL